MQKKEKNQQQPVMLQQYLISIDARLRSRNKTVFLMAETAECLGAEDNYCMMLI